MKFTEKTLDNIPVFELEGKMMGDKMSLLLCNRLQEVVTSGDKNIIVDFRKVNWINSLAMGKMIGCAKKARAKGGEIFFTGLHDRLSYYFKITKLDTILQIDDSIDDALGKLQTSPLIGSAE